MTGTYVVCLPSSARIQTRALGTTGAAGGESPRGKSGFEFSTLDFRSWKM